MLQKMDSNPLYGVTNLSCDTGIKLKRKTSIKVFTIIIINNSKLK